MAYTNPGRVGLIGAPTYAMLRDITQPALLEILSRNHIPFTFNKSENMIELTDCRSRIILRSLNNPDHLRGTNLAWFGVDELTFAKQEAWERLEARLRDPRARRRAGFAVWTPRGFDWVYRKFVNDPVDDYHVTLAKPFENRHVLNVVPDYYEHLKKSYSEEFFKQEVLGQYLNVGCNLVYYEFNRLKHVKPLQIDPHQPIRWSLDFNYRPMCSVVTQTFGDTIHVVDEIVLKPATTDLAAEEFIRRYGNHPGDIVIYGDAAGFAKRSNGPSDFELVRNVLRTAGLSASAFQTELKNPQVSLRIRLVNGKMRNTYGDTHLFVDPKCKELIKDFEQVTYKEDSYDIKKAPERTHTSDALGYVVHKEFNHKPDAGPQPNNLGFTH